MKGRAGEVETDVVLRLLDHQLVGPDGGLLGNVDDLELLHGEEGWLVSGILVGPAALSGRLPVLLGRWSYAVWHRMHPAPDPTALVVPLDHVTSVDSAVHLDGPAAAALSSGFGLELWLREHVVSRLPGAKAAAGSAGAGGDESGPRDGRGRQSPDPHGQPRWPVRVPLEGAHRLSGLLGRPVLSHAGTQLGRVCELRCVGPSHDAPQRPLLVRRLLYTRRLSGWQLGYSADPRQGPWVVGRFLRSRWRRDRGVALEQVGGLEHLDQREADLVLSHDAHPACLDDRGGLAR